MLIKGGTTRWFITYLLFVVFKVNADEVPPSLPHFKALKLYQTYLSQEHNSAFAISQSGAFGASWQQRSVAEAKALALRNCQAMELGMPCEIVSENGVANGDLIDVKNLKGKFRDAQGRIWPAADKDVVPEVIAGNLQQIRAFRDYLSKRGMKAFAVSDSGAWGDGSGHITLPQARQVALSQCASHSDNNVPCVIVNENNLSLVHEKIIDDEK